VTAAAYTPTPEATSLSEGARLVDTFIAPTKTFLDLRRSAAWWGPFLVSAIMGLLFVTVVDQKIGFRKAVENQIQLSSKAADRIEKMPPADRERAMQQQTTVTRFISYGYSGIILLWNALIAAILFATFKFGLSADLDFKRSYAIVMYASLPLVIKTVLAVIAVMAGVNTDSFTFQNPVATNPGYFINAAEHHVLYSLGTALDIFMIWTLVVTAIGFSTNSKVKRGSALAVVFGWYILFVLGSTALGAAFS
jgi:E3 ubiquitin-protein ligase DOA10